MGSRNDSGFALWRANAAQTQRLHYRRGAHARAQHRREHGHLQRDEYTAAALATGRGPGRNRSHSAPEGWRTVTPRIVVHDAKQLVEFLKQVFGAIGEYRQAIPSEVRIGDSVVMISDAGIRSPMTAFLFIWEIAAAPDPPPPQACKSVAIFACAKASPYCKLLISKVRRIHHGV